MNNIDWFNVEKKWPPENVIVNTKKAVPGKPVKIGEKLMRKGRVWYNENGVDLAIFTPTHWQYIK